MDRSYEDTIVYFDKTPEGIACPTSTSYVGLSDATLTVSGAICWAQVLARSISEHTIWILY
jgi:hypothetical protein